MLDRFNNDNDLIGLKFTVLAILTVLYFIV
jgi:hypothetical protein